MSESSLLKSVTRVITPLVIGQWGFSVCWLAVWGNQVFCVHWQRNVDARVFWVSVYLMWDSFSEASTNTQWPLNRYRTVDQNYKYKCFIKIILIILIDDGLSHKYTSFTQPKLTWPSILCETHYVYNGSQTFSSDFKTNTDVLPFYIFFQRVIIIHYRQSEKKFITFRHLSNWQLIKPILIHRTSHINWQWTLK